MNDREAVRFWRVVAIFALALPLLGCGAGAGDTTRGPGVREVTLLYTSDFEFAFNPVL